MSSRKTRSAVPLSGWGRFPLSQSMLYSPASTDDTLNLTKDGQKLIARGNGRSYGDSALADTVLSTRNLNYFQSFDDTTGILVCTAGITIDDIHRYFTPKGWFPPVVPGTKHVTIGGAIASDVHGKNHHVSGSFSDHVLSMRIALGSGEIVECSRQTNQDLFRATCGGMGLTGIILEATFQLMEVPGPFLQQKVFRANNLEDAISILDREDRSTYSVAWIDCLSKANVLGRSIVFTGEHTDLVGSRSPTDFPVPVPDIVPSNLLNKYTLRAFNSLYYHIPRKTSESQIVHYNSFFYPLDSIRHWNRLYGKRGFVQYQIVIPESSGLDSVRKVFSTIAQSRKGSFLAVLKKLGQNNDNYISFPTRGHTLALDFKIDRDIFQFLDYLDEMILDFGGRGYLTKDARMNSTTFRAGYPGWEEFQEARHKYNAIQTFQSLQSTRLGLN